jgi:CRISPR-associated protein Cas2
VFVGRVSALVREKLWGLACEKAGTGAVTLAYHTDNEQGFALRTAGRTSRAVIDLEGLLLVRI